jgi:hypothetical protein
MKRYQFGTFIANISFWIGYIYESIKLVFIDGKGTAQCEVD